MRGPKHLAKTGKTPVLDGTEWRRLIATLTYSFARIGTALKMKVDDLRRRGAGWQAQLRETGDKQHVVPPRAR